MKINFNPRRVFLLTKATLVENQRSILISSAIVAIVSILGCFMVSSAMLLDGNIASGINAEISVNGAQMENAGQILTAMFGGMTAGMLLIICGVKLVTLFTNSVTKRKQTYKFSLPANVSEKYSSNIIIAFILTPIIILLVNTIVLLVTNILLKVVSGTDFQYNIIDIVAIVGGNVELNSFFEIFSIYGLILIGVIFGTGVKRKMPTFLLSIVVIVAVFSLDTIHEWFGEAYVFADIFILLVIWAGTYISFKRKELRS